MEKLLLTGIRKGIRVVVTGRPISQFLFDGTSVQVVNMDVDNDISRFVVHCVKFHRGLERHKYSILDTVIHNSDGIFKYAGKRLCLSYSGKIAN